MLLIGNYFKFEIPYFKRYLLLFELILSINGYVFRIIVFYFLFYVVFKHSTVTHGINIIIICSLIFIITASYLKVSNPWHGSTLCFPLGIIINYYYKTIIEIMRMKYIQNIIVAVMMLGLSITSSFFLSEGSFIGNVVGRNLASLSLCIIVILMVSRLFRKFNSCRLAVAG